MSLLSRYYNRKYMKKTLENRAQRIANNVEENVDNNASRRSLLSSNETYESATSGFFASAGEIIENNTNSGYFL